MTQQIRTLLFPPDNALFIQKLHSSLQAKDFILSMPFCPGSRGHGTIFLCLGNNSLKCLTRLAGVKLKDLAEFIRSVPSGCINTPEELIKVVYRFMDNLK